MLALLVAEAEGRDVATVVVTHNPAQMPGGHRSLELDIGDDPAGRTVLACAMGALVSCRVS